MIRQARRSFSSARGLDCAYKTRQLGHRPDFVTPTLVRYVSFYHIRNFDILMYNATRDPRVVHWSSRLSMLWLCGTMQWMDCEFEKPLRSESVQLRMQSRAVISFSSATEIPKPAYACILFGDQRSHTYSTSSGEDFGRQVIWHCWQPCKPSTVSFSLNGSTATPTTIVAKQAPS